jgi:phosphate starvation-inducible membrane PsiE
MSTEHWFEIVEGIFCFVLLWSYMTLAIRRGVRSHFHVSCMIWSYVILIGLIGTYTPYHYDDWRVWPLGFALILGAIGLFEYYRSKLMLEMANGKR